MVLIEDAMEDPFNNDNMSIGLDKLFAILDEPPSQGFQQPNPPSSRLNSVKNPVKSEMQPEVPVIDLNSPPPDVLSNEYMSCISDSSMDSSPTSDYIVPAQSVVDDDDDDDICVLDDDDVGHPPPVAAATKAYHNYGSHHHASPNYVSRHHASQNYGAEQYGSGVARPNADDERLTYRAVLQDLSQPTSEAIPPDGLLAVPLLKHQRIALSWMVKKETASFNCCGGILADDQGLGKTISTISLILTERSPPAWSCSLKVKHEEFEPLNLDDDDDDDDDVAKRPRCCGPVKRENSDGMELKGRPAGGTLVVCPTSVLRQWNEELHNKVTRDANLSVLIYHGSKRTKDPCELARYDVVLTTYAIVGMEVPKQPPAEGDDNGWPVTVKKRKQSSSSDAENHKGRKKKVVNTVVPRALARVGWFRVVLDEAQMIKNYRTQVARACWGIRAKRRWCLSGTPIQNSIDDLYSYFRFLRFDPYAVYASFRLKIKGPILGNPTKGYKKLQAVLKTILLRRTKETLLDGKPIITLPPKMITLKKLDFSKEERIYYERLEGDFREQFKEYADAGTIEQNYVNILLMLLRLRQACGHPLLVGGFDADSAWRLTKEMAKKPPKDKQMDLLRCLEASVAICAICNDAPEDAVVTICGHVFCNQCIREHLTEDDNICPSASCRVQLTADSVFSKGELKGSPSSEWGRGCSGSGPEMVRKPVSYRGDLSCDSTKVKAAVEILRSLPTCSNGQVTEKAIVFSQWTKMLDLLEVPLTNSSVQYRRLDGTMSVADRDIAVKEFNTLPQVTVMLMSLKAASLGLNMVAACHVVLLDLWWNPTTEDQAIDRAHRIGQTRPVTVSRFTVTGTVEDRILALQQKKREMIASAFGEEPGGRHTRLTVDDLKYLFMV